MPGHSQPLTRYSGTIADSGTANVDVDLVALDAMGFDTTHVTITTTVIMTATVTEGRDADAFASLPHPLTAETTVANQRLDLIIPHSPAFSRLRINLANSSGSTGTYVVDIGLSN